MNVMSILNKFISKQLNLITVPIQQLSNTKFIILKQTIDNINTEAEFNIGETYNIVIEDYILNPPPTFTLSENWNAGTKPPEKELIAKVLQIAGKMIKFNCIGKNTNFQWEGWLPKKSIKEVSICH